MVGVPLLVFAGLTVRIRMLDRTTGTIVSSGLRRDYILHVPPTYDPLRPAPLVISLHGAAGWPEQQEAMTGWNRLADAYGFLVVYPGGADRPRVWQVEQGPGLARDVRYIADLVDTIEGAYRIDRSRIYANGLSNGGAMAFVLSCTMADRIAAVGLVAAAEQMPFRWCPDTRPVPAISFHGTADPIVPFHGGRSRIASSPFPDVPRWSADWAARNGCRAAPVRTTVTPHVARTEWGNCEAGASVQLWVVEGGGHTWPGGKPLPRLLTGPTTREVDATALMWDFFRDHPLAIVARRPVGRMSKAR